eukprot:scaffold12925_cov57-Cyclotella_meneghiniana.AAC.2
MHGHYNRRESEDERWWRPRAEAVAKYISENLEWWFDDKFADLFDSYLQDQFYRVAERRPGPKENSMYKYLQQDHDDDVIRDDGMCCLVSKHGKLDLVSSSKVLTGPERIAQIVHCKERGNDGGADRDILIANTHLSFPKDADQVKNDRRQAYEINLIQRALSKMSSSTSSNNSEVLEVICGDFNSEPNGLASAQLESRDFVNCASAKGEQTGVTHIAHTGQEMSVDHIFVRLPRKEHSQLERGTANLDFVEPNSEANADTNFENRSRRRTLLSFGYQDPLSLGCIDTAGTEIINVKSADIRIKGRGVLSDHKPVTATLRWPKFRAVGKLSEPYVNFSNSTMPLDPLSFLCASEL